MAKSLKKNFGKQWVSLCVTTLDGLTDQLGELDRRAGDGDFGTNLSTAMRLARKNIKTQKPEGYEEWVQAVSTAFLGVGGTSGPLFGMFFRDLSKAGNGKAPSARDFALAVSQALKTNQHYGGAQVGEKTMVDALAPAAKKARKSSKDGAKLLARIAEAAVEGALSTRDIVASKGRASYVGEVARGVLDPGAATVAVIFQCAAAAADPEYRVKTGWVS